MHFECNPCLWIDNWGSTDQPCVKTLLGTATCTTEIVVILGIGSVLVIFSPWTAWCQLHTSLLRVCQNRCVHGQMAKFSGSICPHVSRELPRFLHLHPHLGGNALWQRIKPKTLKPEKLRILRKLSWFFFKITHDNKSLDSQLSQMGNPNPSPRSSVWSPPQRSRNLRHGRLSYTFRCMFSKHLKKKGLAVTQTRFYMILYQPAFAQTSFYTD